LDKVGSAAQSSKTISISEIRLQHIPDLKFLHFREWPCRGFKLHESYLRRSWFAGISQLTYFGYCGTFSQVLRITLGIGSSPKSAPATTAPAAIGRALRSRNQHSPIKSIATIIRFLLRFTKVDRGTIFQRHIRFRPVYLALLSELSKGDVVGWIKYASLTRARW
jgi:hypothetical protein